MILVDVVMKASPPPACRFIAAGWGVKGLDEVSSAGAPVFGFLQTRLGGAVRIPLRNRLSFLLPERMGKYSHCSTYCPLDNGKANRADNVGEGGDAAVTVVLVGVCVEALPENAQRLVSGGAVIVSVYQVVGAAFPFLLLFGGDGRNSAGCCQQGGQESKELHDCFSCFQETRASVGGVGMGVCWLDGRLVRACIGINEQDMTGFTYISVAFSLWVRFRVSWFQRSSPRQESRFWPTSLCDDCGMSDSDRAA